MSPLLIVWLLFVHWLGDWAAQSRAMAEGKSSSNAWLSYHVVVYTAILWVGTLFGYECFHTYTMGSLFTVPTLYAAINGVLHWGTDHETSRYNAFLYRAPGGGHPFWTAIGFDGWLHQTTLILTAWWLLS